jgi:hexosaminidase
MRMVALLALCLGLCASAADSTDAQPQLNLMPMPAKVQVGDGQLIIDAAFSVSASGPADPVLEKAVDRFLLRLRQRIGMTALDMRLAKLPPAILEVHIEYAIRGVQSLDEDESYVLEVNSTGAHLTAPTRLGAMHGLQTFLQLVEDSPAGFAVPAVSIEDHPRFPWRGLMIDASRHFMPVEVVERNLDGMEALKLNVFHWHLSDDQGFRVESKRFPKLQGMGSDSLYYTQEQIHEVVRYAADRGIRVIPEFDVPGHTTSWFVGYPWLASAPGPYRIERQWGVFNPAMDPTKESTYKFLDEFIGEMTRLFPDRYFHIGGDEVNGKQWDRNPHIAAFKRAHHLSTDDDLQAYFNKRLQRIVSKYGKTMMGWDEILQPDLPKNIVIQSWRGQQSLADAAKQGYRGILSSGYYLDLIWPAWRHYTVDPISNATANLTPEQQRQILGGEACMWAEYVSPENVDSRIWPRMAAIAERLWSPLNVQDVNSMYARMEVVSKELDDVGLTHNTSYQIMLRRIAGSDEIGPLRVLADVVEPTKDYTRHGTSPIPPTSLVPLNRLIDAARPESMTARHFASTVDALLAGQADAAAKAKEMLTRWQENDAKFEPLASESFLAKEVVPASQNLTAVAAIGLQALDYLERHEPAPDAWKTQQLALLEQAKTPRAQVLLMIVDPVEKLVQAAATPPVSH